MRGNRSDRAATACGRSATNSRVVQQTPFADGLAGAQMTTAARSQHRFEALDGLRGVAAIAVVFYHVGHWLELTNFVRHGYLAVDVFFCLSGFVMASAYEKRLTTGMEYRDFVWRRIIRLWPLIVLGAALGGLAQLASGSDLGVDGLSGSGLAVAIACAALLIPMVWNDRLFPVNDPIWSLFLEVLINLVWAAAIKGLRTWVLLIIVGASALALAYLAREAGSASGGHNVETLALGIARVVVSYTIGLLLYRIHQTGLVRITLPTPALALLILATLSVPSLSRGGVVFDLFVVLIAVPAIILLASNQPNTGSKFWKFSGDISYPLYVLHQPLWFLASAVLATTHATMDLRIATALAGVFVAISWAVLKIYDEPTRRRLSSLSTRVPKPA